MSISAIMPHSLSGTSTSTKAAQIANEVNKSPDWTYLVPVIGILALGILLFPASVPIGMGLGVASLTASIAILFITRCLNLHVKDDKKKKRVILFLKNLRPQWLHPFSKKGFLEEYSSRLQSVLFYLLSPRHLQHF